MDSLQLIILQENVQKSGLLSTLPIHTTYFNTTKVPSSSPTITSIKSHSSSSISLAWTPVSSIYLHGRSLMGYRIFYKETTSEYSLDQTKSVTHDKLEAIVDELKTYTEYSFRVLAFTKNGNGISSDPVDIRTDEDVPSVPPLNLRANAVSSSAITAEWDLIDPKIVRGIVKGYNLTVVDTETGQTRFQILGPSEVYAMIKGLEHFTEYSVQVCGFTSKGCGMKAKAVVTTPQNAPTKPPENPVVLNLSSTSELTISWDPPSGGSNSGMLQGYTLKYKIKKTSGSDMDDTPVIVKTLGRSDNQYTLRNLIPYTVYEIGIAARSKAGLGPFAYVYGETCRCPRIIYTNHWFLTPYFNKTDQGKIQGIFFHIIPKMIMWACGECKNGHGKTVVDFVYDGHGSLASKESMVDVIANIHHGTQVSFPINGNKYMDKIYGSYPFVSVVESPGVAFLSFSRPVSPAWDILMSVFNTWPFIVFSFLLSYLAGAVVWYLDYKTKGSTFHRPFIKGVGEGTWWSFISMTTVGYGDRTPMSISARIFSIFWILYGMVLVSILTSSLTTSLTTITIETAEKIYGVQVATIQNSSEYRLGLLLNGKVNQVRPYHSVEDIRQALKTREVEGALIDTYVVARDIQRFTDDGIKVTKLVDRPFGYGIALSETAAPIEKECRDYLRLHEDQILRLVDRSTGKLRKPTVSSSVERSSGLFDSTSDLYRKSVMFLGSVLLFAFMSGLVWQCIYKAKFMNKVASSKVLERKQDLEATRNVLKQMLEEFHVSVTGKIESMRKRHLKELLRLRNLKKKIITRTSREEEKERKKTGEDDDFNIVFKRALNVIREKDEYYEMF